MTGKDRALFQGQRTQLRMLSERADLDARHALIAGGDIRYDYDRIARSDPIAFAQTLESFADRVFGIF